MIEALQLLSILFDSKFKKNFILLIILAVIVSIIEILGIGGVLFLITSIMKDPYIFNLKIWKIIGVGEQTNIITIIIGVLSILLLIFRAGLMYFSTWAQQRYKFQCNHYLSKTVLMSYLAKDYSFYLSNNSENMIKNVADEVFRVTEQVIGPIIAIITNFVIVLGVGLFVLIFKPGVTLILMLSMLPISYLVFVSVKNKMSRIGNESIKYNGLRYRYAGEALRGIKEVKIYKSENYFFTRFERASNKFSSIQVPANVLPEIPRMVLETVGFVGLLGYLIYQSFSGVDIEKIMPSVVVLALSAYRLMPLINKIVNGFTKIRFGLPSLRLISNVIIEKNVNAAKKICLEFSSENYININGLKYTYPDSPKMALDNINIYLQKGKVVGFAGRSGSGKTTLIDVLSGLLAPDSIVVNNETIKYIKYDCDHMKISYVPQRVFLVDDSIKNNIVFGLDESGIDDDWLLEVIKMAHLEEYITNHPLGIDMDVGESGIKISGGQAQRIGIARALYRKPDILILDEATSALDGISEEFINKTITECAKINITVLVIAHRSTTIAKCDYIYLIDNSKVISEGTYSELYNKSEIFRRFCTTPDGMV